MLAPSKAVNKVEPDAARAAWIANQLLNGELPLLVVDRLCISGVSRDAASRDVATALADPYLDSALLRARRGRKTAALLELQYAMWRRAAESKGICELRELDCERFAEDFYFANRPFIFRGGAADWRAIGTWSPAWFRERYGSVEIDYSAVEGAKRYARQGPDLARTTLREFVDRIETTVASNEYYLTASSRTMTVGGPLAGLSADIAPLPFAPEMSRKWTRSLNLWLGPRGTLTQLHHDLLNVLFVQVWGTKEFILGPSFGLPLMRNRFAVYSEIDPLVPSPDSESGSADLAWLRFTVEPGDVVFIPAGWWHWVYASTASISVGLTDVNVAGQTDELPIISGRLVLSNELEATSAAH